MTTATNREFVIPLENKPGTLAEVATALGKSNVNVLGYLLEAQGDFGVARFVTSDPAKTEAWLRSTGRPFRANEIVIAPAKPQPGELGRIATTLAQSGVNITASYATEDGLAFAVDNVASARKALGV